MALPQKKNVWNKWKNHFYEMKGDVGMSLHEKGRNKKMPIRASVDALCRDGTSEISRDPRTKRLQTRRESLARPSKHTNSNL